jgi:hypothetical protein
VIPAGDGGISAMSLETGLGDVLGRRTFRPGPVSIIRCGSVTSAGLGLHTACSTRALRPGKMRLLERLAHRPRAGRESVRLRCTVVASKSLRTNDRIVYA